MLHAERDPLLERQKAKALACAEGIPVASVAAVCTLYPWTDRIFRHREAAWWLDEMRDLASRPERPIAEVCAEQLEAVRLGRCRADH
jgi:hypothetical protein